MKVFSMRLNSTTPKTSAAAVKIRLYTMPNVVTVPVPKVAMRKISIGDEADSNCQIAVLRR